MDRQALVDQLLTARMDMLEATERMREELQGLGSASVPFDDAIQRLVNIGAQHTALIVQLLSLIAGLAEYVLEQPGDHPA